MNFETKDFVHIGAELVIIGGVSVYFFKQTSALKAQVAELQKELEVLKKVIQGHDQALGAIMGIPQQKSPAPTPAPQPPRHPPSTQSQPKAHPPVKKHKKKRVEELPPSEDELDNELKEELGELKSKSVKEDEEDCKDGVCKLTK